VLKNEVDGKTFVCSAAELGMFTLPGNFASCSAIPGAPGGLGYAASTGGARMCAFCPIPDGQTIIEDFGATTSKWYAVLACIVWIVIARIGAGYGFRYKRFVTR
jgi:hypothetical protein